MEWPLGLRSFAKSLEKGSVELVLEQVEMPTWVSPDHIC